MQVTQSCLTLCFPTDYTAHGIFQARILEWAAFPFSKGSSQPRDQTQVLLIAGQLFTSWVTREAQTCQVNPKCIFSLKMRWYKGNRDIRHLLNKFAAQKTMPHGRLGNRAAECQADRQADRQTDRGGVSTTIGGWRDGLCWPRRKTAQHPGPL